MKIQRGFSRADAVAVLLIGAITLLSIPTLLAQASGRQTELSRRVVEDTVDALRAADAPRLVLGAALYNLACLRARENRVDDVLSLLKEAFPMRPDLKAAAAEDSDLGAVRNDARFQDLLKP